MLWDMPSCITGQYCPYLNWLLHIQDRKGKKVKLEWERDGNGVRRKQVNSLGFLANTLLLIAEAAEVVLLTREGT